MGREGNRGDRRSLGPGHRGEARFPPERQGGHVERQRFCGSHLGPRGECVTVWRCFRRKRKAVHSCARIKRVAAVEYSRRTAMECTPYLRAAARGPCKKDSPCPHPRLIQEPTLHTSAHGSVQASWLHCVAEDLRFKEETGFVEFGIPGSHCAPKLTESHLCVSGSTYPEGRQEEHISKQTSLRGS